MRPAVEVHTVSVHRGHVEAADSPSYSLAISGAVDPGDGDGPRVEARVSGELVGSTGARADRGFSLIVDTLALAPRFEVEVAAGGAPLGTVSGERATLPAAPRRNIQPILVPALGRTGSSWLVRLLGEHPSIVAHRSFELEPRAVYYWASVLTDISNPASYWQMLATSAGGRWWLGEGATADGFQYVDEELRAELGRDAIDELCAFTQRRVERFYRAAARIAGVRKPRFFIEKGGHTWRTMRLVAEQYPRCRELILVRDFRDMLASMLAFNEKRSISAFGRQRVETDDEFVRYIRDYAAGLYERYRSRGEHARLVRYEDLVREPERTLTGMLEWLGLDASPRAVSATLASASRETQQMRDHRTAPSVEESIGRWRRDLPAQLRERSCEVFAGVLADFGYEV